MQEHVYQLNPRQGNDLDESFHVSFVNTKAPYKFEAAPYVSIYNEDDLSHFLYRHTKAFDDAELRRSNEHAHSVSNVAPPLDDYFPVAPPEYSDDSGFTTDDEDEGLMNPTTGSSLSPESSTSSMHHPNLCSRFAEPALLDAAVDSKSGAFRQLNSKHRKVESAAEIQPVSTIEGTLMSWWPLPLDQEVYDWTPEEEHEMVNLVVPESQHVDQTEETCMSWWPMPMGMENYEWDEKFYE
jgi:hypothetical protein